MRYIGGMFLVDHGWFSLGILVVAIDGTNWSMNFNILNFDNFYGASNMICLQT